MKNLSKKTSTNFQQLALLQLNKNQMSTIKGGNDGSDGTDIIITDSIDI